MKRLILILCLSAVSSAWAATWNCATVSRTDVAAKLDATINTSLADGDTVVIPAGTDTTTWTSGIVVTKAVTLKGSATAPTGQGAGTISTHISGASGLGTGGLFTFTFDPTKFVDISGLDLRSFQTGTLGPIQIDEHGKTGGYFTQCYRVHNCSFNRLDASGNGCRVLFVNDAYGLTDHITIYESGSGGSPATSGIINVEAAEDVYFVNNWHIPQSWGDGNSNFIEDSIITCSQGTDSLTDGNGGGKVVMRHTAITNCGGYGMHGFDSAIRSFLMAEFYNNTITDTANMASFTGNELRGGAMLSHDNTWTCSSCTQRQTFFSLRYYAAASDSFIGTQAFFKTRATAYYPTGTWGTNPIPSVSNVNDGAGNMLSGSDKLDGNTQTINHMDSGTSTTYTDVTMTSGNTSISSTTAAFSSSNFTNRDQYRMVIGPNIVGIRYIADGVITGGNQLSSGTVTFGAGDVGRVIVVQPAAVAATIGSVSGGVATITPSLSNGTGLAVRISGAWIVSESSGTAVLNCPPTGNNTANGTLTIGYTDMGYPALDQPGFGPFASANAGNWPNSSSYTLGNYERQNPVYQWNNTFYGNSSPTIIVAYPGDEAYIKVNREFYNRAPQSGDAIFPYTPYTYPHPLQGVVSSSGHGKKPAILRRRQ